MPNPTPRTVRKVTGPVIALALPMLLSGPAFAAMWAVPHYRQQSMELPIVLVGSSNTYREGATRLPPSGHSPRGGIGINVMPGILALPQVLKDNDSDQEPKRSKPKQSTTVDMTCRGGLIRRGQCVCPGSKIKETVGRNAFACTDRPASNTATVTPPETCVGGVKRKGRCQCPPGKVLVDAACRTAEQSPPVIAVPTTGPANQHGSGLPPPAVSPPATPQAPIAQAPAGEFIADQVLVTFARTTPESVDDAIAQDHGLELLERLTVTLIDTRVVRYRIPDGRTVAALLAALQADPRAGAPQANFLYRTGAGAVSIESGQLQYALAKVDATSAHLLAHGRGALIAVIDSGIDASHPDLEAAVAQSYDAVGDGDKTPDGHGTAVAGIIRAHGTVEGIAPQARLLDVRAFASQAQGRPAAATSFILVRSLDWSVEKGARVLNLSFAGPRDPLIERVVKAAHARRAIIVAAAGNAGPTAPPAYPAAYEDVIAVTATDSADRLYTQANHGPYIAIAAPGVDILAPTARHAHQLYSGTSFAAAYVSGIIALMLERNPHLSAETARLALMAAASDLGAPGRDDEFGAGRANAYGSLRLLDQAGAPYR
jgi:hypothetical protein